jgi:hypothetical protein
MARSILDGVTGRRPLGSDGGRSGAVLEAATLADGTPVVIKHIRPDDWLMVVTGGVPHLFNVWRSGLLKRVPSQIDHAMIEMEEHGDGWVLIMRDVSDAVLAEGRVLSRAENRRVLEAIDALHAEFMGEDVPGVPLVAHCDALTPERSKTIETLDTPIPGLIQRGWELFPDVAPRDVSDAMLAVIADTGALAREMLKTPQTLIHGDVRLHNMGLTDEQLVLLDWEVVGGGPPATDFAWYLIISASRIDATREQVIDDYRTIAGDRFDDRAWELACIGAVTWLGWNKAIDIIDNPDPAIRAQERADLDWWIARLRQAFEAWSPV